jgi:hypothetical protein
LAHPDLLLGGTEAHPEYIGTNFEKALFEVR